MEQQTLSERIQIAKLQTWKATKVQAWRLTRKADRQAQEKARQLGRGKGYIIMDGCVWGYYASVPDSRGRVRIDLIKV